MKINLKSVFEINQLKISLQAKTEIIISVASTPELAFADIAQLYAYANVFDLPFKHNGVHLTLLNNDDGDDEFYIMGCEVSREDFIKALRK